MSDIDIVAVLAVDLTTQLLVPEDVLVGLAVNNQHWKPCPGRIVWLTVQQVQKWDVRPD